jgi:hypothetical protein
MVLPGKPRGSPTLKAVEDVTANGRGGVFRGGVDDRGTFEEDGPVTWEAPVCPRTNAGLTETPHPKVSDAPGVRERTSGRFTIRVRTVVGRRRGETGALANAAGESEGCI